MLWEIDIYPADGEPDRAGQHVAAEARHLGVADDLRVVAARGYLVQGKLSEADVARLCRELLVDDLVEQAVVGKPGAAGLQRSPDGLPTSLHVLPKPGVMDPVAASVVQAGRDLQLGVDQVRTFRKYWLPALEADRLATLSGKLLANDAIEQVVCGPLELDRLEVGSAYRFQLITVPIRGLDDAALERLSREGQLYLSLAEMRTIQARFRELGRDPTDAELETLAQTWSEHCSHKTLAGRIRYRGPEGERRFENMLKETIFAATHALRGRWGDADWCVSVFRDNAGVVRFDEAYNVCFKVETHNHPSALEPYGGANTGLGGVIRDPLGTGLGAKPVCNTDVFCFAPPDLPADQVPRGVLHPMRVMRGVVAGVRDYGNRMGIPTVNGAICFDPRYLANPLVYCGNVGLIPRDKSLKEPKPGDYIVAVGGRTGRDGIHGATFSSAELTTESEQLSGGAVQIGNAITEKMLVDVLLAARDRGLFHAITDCGAGGFSSAVGEMGADIGAEVWLDRIPLKYEGLSYAEMWISEAQERMILAVPPEAWDEFQALCRAENVEATVLGAFLPTGRLQLRFQDHLVADLPMDFLHDGRPPVVREAVWQPAPEAPLPLPEKHTWDYTPELLAILAAPNVCSKEWVIRQYDHEVQGGSVLKPLVGVDHDAPGDAAVVRPVLGSRRGLVIGCGLNPRYGDLDPYHMAASAIDEALRNCVAVGADPRRVAILDNFCWGDCEQPETLGALVRAALACHDLALALETPFISGKDSLNNVFRQTLSDGSRRVLSIPHTLLISALGQVDDVARCVSMDLKQPGNLIYQVGLTRGELGGSHFALIHNLSGGAPPTVDPALARATFLALHSAIQAGLVQACHDLSEGGLAVAAAEMAFAGRLGLRLELDSVPQAIPLDAATEATIGEWRSRWAEYDWSPLAASPWSNAQLLFSESNTRFLCEVRPDDAEAFSRALGSVPHAVIGEVVDNDRLAILGLSTPRPAPEPGEPPEWQTPQVIDAPLDELKQAWQDTLRWD